MASRRAAALAATMLLGSAGVVVARALADEDRRHRLSRQARVWRLSARRGAHFVAVKVAGSRASDEARARLEEQFAIRTAEDVAAVLGGMKGAIMKAGQMISFIAEGMPPEARAALASLQQDVPPMAPSLAEAVIQQELGRHPEEVFLEWNPVPIAAASIGQVHKAVTRDGRIVAVKVQYPDVDKAIKSDLDNAEFLYGLFAQFALKNMDVKSLVDELRRRMGDELDYRLEAKLQQEFADRYRGHPFIHIPDVVQELSTQRVFVNEWVDGMRFADFVTRADQAAKQTAAEVLLRFAHGSIQRHGVFNGDPHPGNYLFHPDGSITFLDFGLVKRWDPGELESLAAVLDGILAGDAERTVREAVAAGFLPSNHGLDEQLVFEYLGGPYEPFTYPEFRYTREWTAHALQQVVDVQGRYSAVMRSINIPPSYIILQRVVWGLSALLGQLEGENRWGAILAEYRKGAPPATPLGQAEKLWRDRGRHAR